MVDNLLKEKGNRVEQFLHSHEGIRWIRCIQDGEYKKVIFRFTLSILSPNIQARKILKSMSEHETDSKKRLASFIQLNHTKEHQFAMSVTRHAICFMFSINLRFRRKIRGNKGSKLDNFNGFLSVIHILRFTSH